jgi:hypothetical protein
VLAIRKLREFNGAIISADAATIDIAREFKYRVSEYNADQ